MTLKYNQVADALAKLKFPEQGSDPIPYANDGYLYSKDVAGRTELFYMDDIGRAIQVTKDGYLYIRSLQSRFVSSTAPTDGYALIWNQSLNEWLSGKPIPGGTAGGDLFGTFPRPVVAKIQSHAFSSTSPLDGYVPVWNNAASMWSPQVQDGYRLQNRTVANTPPLDGYLLQWNAALNRWQPGTASSGYGMTSGLVTPPLETITLLGLMPTAGMVDGTLAYVKNVDDIYYLKRTGSYTPDGYDVVAASGGGYWVSRIQGRWNDMLGDITQGTAASALTYEAFRDTPWNLYCMRHDQDDALSMRFQLPHMWRYGTAVVSHMHVLPLADPVSPQNVYFDGYYVWTEADNPSNPVPALSGWTRFTKHFTIDPGNINVQRYVDFGPITPPVWAKESSILLIYVRRSGTSPADTYTTNKVGGTTQANLGLLYVDVHYRVNKLGSLPEKPT